MQGVAAGLNAQRTMRAQHPTAASELGSIRAHLLLLGPVTAADGESYDLHRADDATHGEAAIANAITAMISEEEYQ